MCIKNGQCMGGGRCVILMGGVWVVGGVLY